MSLEQIKKDPEMNDYFNRLPVMIQESIVQSGAPFTDIQELKRFVWDIERFQGDGSERR